MQPDEKQSESDRTKPRYVWPWFVLAAVLLGVLMAFLWMTKEIRRARLVRDLSAPAPQVGPR